METRELPEDQNDPKSVEMEEPTSAQQQPGSDVGGSSVATGPSSQPDSSLPFVKLGEESEGDKKPVGGYDRAKRRAVSLCPRDGQLRTDLEPPEPSSGRVGLEQPRSLKNFGPSPVTWCAQCIRRIVEWVTEDAPPCQFPRSWGPYDCSAEQKLPCSKVSRLTTAVLMTRLTFFLSLRFQ